MWIKINKDIFDKAEFKSLNFLYQILSWNPTSSSLPRYNFFVDTEIVQESTNFRTLSYIENSLKEFLDIEYLEFVNSSSKIGCFYFYSNI